MSGKLLIVGDSLCSRYLQETRKVRTDDYLWKIPDYKYWFEYLGEKLNLDIVNFSFNGSGNQQIFDNTLHAINTNDDIDLAIICWSGFDRIDLPSSSYDRNCLHLNLVDKIEDVSDDMRKKYHQYFVKDNLFDIYIMIDKFINYCISIDNLFKSKNIKLIQTFSIVPYLEGLNENRPKSSKVYQYYINHSLFNKINEKSFFLYPGTDMLGGSNLYELYGPPYNKRASEYVLNPKKLDNGFVVDSHPNAEGNKIIFDALYRFILDKY